MAAGRIGERSNKLSLKEFNNKRMDNGMPPVRLLRERLLKEKAKWGEIL